MSLPTRSVLVVHLEGPAQLLLGAAQQQHRQLYREILEVDQSGGAVVHGGEHKVGVATQIR